MDIVPTTCLCGNRDGWPVSRTSDNLVIVQLCKHCGMGYARNYPDAELLAVYYRHIYRDRTKDTPETRWNKQVEHGKDILAWLDGDIRFPISRMLDVGCATGGDRGAAGGSGGVESKSGEVGGSEDTIIRT